MTLEYPNTRIIPDLLTDVSPVVNTLTAKRELTCTCRTPPMIYLTKINLSSFANVFQINGHK